MDPEIRRLRTGYERTFWLLDAISGALIILMTAVIMIRVFNRWFGLGLSGQGELAQIMMLWVVFLGIAGAAYADRDIKSEFLFYQLPERLQAVVKLVILVVCLLVVLGLFVSSLLVIENRWHRVTTSLGWPVPVTYAPLAIGSGLLLCVYTTRLLAYLRWIYGQFTQWRGT